MRYLILLFIFAFLLSSQCIKAGEAETKIVEMHTISNEGKGESIGTLHLTDTKKGLKIKADLRNLPPGKHGFHIHAKGVCNPGMKNGKMIAGLAAGGHFDPGDTKTHAGPYGDGHLGDLPVLEVNKDGRSNEKLIAPRLKIKDILTHAIIIHQGGDTYSDTPPLGGGAARIACGIVK